MENRQNVWYKKLSEPETDNLGKDWGRQKDKVEKTFFQSIQNKKLHISECHPDELEWLEDYLSLD